MNRHRLTSQELMLRAAEIIEENGWCRGHYAINEFGNSVPVFDKHAVKFCIVGAMQKAALDSGDPENMSLLVEAKQKFAIVNRIHPATFNDEHAKDKHDASYALRKAANS